MKQKLGISILSVLILSLGCAQDKTIRLESDVGEVLLVPEAAVSVTRFDKDKAVEEIRGYLVSRREDYTSLFSCEGSSLFRTSEEICVSERQKAKAMEDFLENPDPFLKDGEPFVTVKYRPVFIDVAKKRTAGEYTEIHCPNPSLASRNLWFWNFIYGMTPLEAQSPKLIDVLKVSVCEQYASFK